MPSPIRAEDKNRANVKTIGEGYANGFKEIFKKIKQIFDFS